MRRCWYLAEFQGRVLNWLCSGAMIELGPDGWLRQNSAVIWGAVIMPGPGLWERARSWPLT